MEVRVSLDERPTNVDEPTQRLSVVDTGRHHQTEADDADRRSRLAMAWRRVDRQARDLVTLYERVRVPTTQAFVEAATGRRKDRLWLAVWLLSRYEPTRRAYMETMDGRACGTTTVPEIMGVALLVDGELCQYRLVKGHAMLTMPLRQATPESPPATKVFEALAARALGRR